MTQALLLLRRYKKRLQRSDNGQRQGKDGAVTC